MRPILVQLPSKVLFGLALVLAAGSLVRYLVRRRGDPKAPWPSTPLYLLGAAWLLLGLRGGGWIPSASVFSKAWLPVPIYAYGVMLGTSMIVGWFLALSLARKDGIPQEQAGVIYMWTAVWSIVGARILYVIVQWHTFDSFVEVFMLQNGGLVAYGGMIGGFLASWYNCHKRKIPLLKWADVAAPSVVLGTAMTRVGCLMFGCDYGKRTDLPWAIQFPKESPAWKDHVHNFDLARDAARSFSIHPTQIYEILAGLALFGLLMLVRRVRRFSGQVFLVWVIGYGILRPIIEVFRDDDQRGAVGPFSTSQFIGLTSVVLGLGLLAHLIKRYRQDPASLRYWQMPSETAAAGHAGGSGGPRPGTGKRRKRR
jgi:prolipoprotein diacylglyceryl transferase